jgi:hypothetical protein
MSKKTKKGKHSQPSPAPEPVAPPPPTAADFRRLVADYRKESARHAETLEAMERRWNLLGRLDLPDEIALPKMTAICNAKKSSEKRRSQAMYAIADAIHRLRGIETTGPRTAIQFDDCLIVVVPYPRGDNICDVMLLPRGDVPKLDGTAMY